MEYRRLFTLILITFLALTACTGLGGGAQEVPPTATLAPIVSLTPRFTATPIPSRTPMPTATFTSSPTEIPPTPSDTPTPSPTPPIMGSVASVNSINVREGPGVEFPAIIALRPGTRVEVLGTNNDGTWLNVRVETDNGELEGWVSAPLIRIQETPTPIPTLTASPDLTALFLGTPLPTALLGGGTVTPTPPNAIVTATLPGTEEVALEPTATGGLLLPNIEAINQTATALAGGGSLPRPVDPDLGGPTGGPISSGSPTAPPAGSGGSGDPAVRAGVDILAYCDDRSYGSPPPSDLRAGSTVDVFWSWWAQTRAQVQDHIDAAVYEVTLDGRPFTNWRQYTGSVREDGQGRFIVYWFMPSSEPLTPGEHRITYSVTWTRAISDGFQQFGPGTSNPSESGSCTFTVR